MFYREKEGNMNKPKKYVFVGDFEEGMAQVKSAISGKWGYINNDYEETIPCVFDMAFRFFNGIAMVKQDGLFGFVDKCGCLVIPCKYKSEEMAFKAGNRWQRERILKEKLERKQKDLGRNF